MSKGKVFVQGDFCPTQIKAMYARYGYTTASNVADADIVVWTGGRDISPELYGEKPVYSYSVSKTRDDEDLAVLAAALHSKKFLVGICRGAQLLNCRPNGGQLFQDVDMHGNSDHMCRDYITNELVALNSLHHQMMRPSSEGLLVAGCKMSTVRRSEGYRSTGLQEDPEVVWYPRTRSLCFQPHPEFAHPYTTNYFFSLMDRYYLGNKSRALVTVPDKITQQEVEDEIADAIARAYGNCTGCDADGEPVIDAEYTEIGEELAIPVEEATASVMDVSGQSA